MSESNETVEAICRYCGHTNPTAVSVCPGCGSPLGNPAPTIEDSAPKKKSKLLAVILAVTLGPLGLFYASISGGAIMIVVAFVLYIATRGGWWFIIGGRIICVVWAVGVLYEEDQEPNSKRDSKRFLNEAASLESVDRARAIEAYEKVIRLYPGTRASREAERNIQTLSKE